jgi:MFS family permease
MLGMFFFMALYMQNVLDYSPLEAGVRFLPSTLMIVIFAPLSGRLTDRIGPRPPIVAGMLIVTVSLYLQSRVGVDTAYSQLLVPFVLMGIGMALVMSPMSTAAMNAVDVTKSGLASGILSMWRMVGGTFGVAVLGAIFQAETGSAIGGAPQEFVDALGTSLTIGAAVTLAGAGIAVLTLSGGMRRVRVGDPAAETAAAEAAAGGADIAVEPAASR